jgi:hypothetical protein
MLPAVSAPAPFICASNYVLNGSPIEAELFAKLGKHTTGKGCLYIKRLTDVDERVLEELVRDSAKHKS